MADLSGQVLGRRYRVDQSIGLGGMARVYKAWDQQRAVYLALKVLDHRLAADPVFLSRFEQEAQILEQLQHPNIVRIYGLEKSDGLAFILMDFIDGLTLRQEIKISPGGIRPERISQILQPVCAGLHYAHQMGLVHCDIKPGNIMIHRNGTVYLTDFGIARVHGASPQPLASTGTLAYMAPEHIRGQNPTPEMDVYALGVVLFEMLTGGMRPFQDPTGQGNAAAGSLSEKAVLNALLEEKSRPTPPSPRTYRPDISLEMEAVVIRCLEPDPRFRYASTLDLLRAWEAAVRGDPSEGEAHTLTGGATVTYGDKQQPTVRQLFDRLQGLPKSRIIAGAATLAVIAALVVSLSSILGRPQGNAANHTITPPALSAATGVLSTTADAVPSATTTPQYTPTLAAATATPTIPAPTATTFGGGTGTDGLIAFASDRGDGITPQIWVILAAGRERSQITNVFEGACQPTWSPDGKQIAYITPCTGPRETYPGANIEIIDLASRKVTPLNLPGGGFDPDWSPDGKTIAYTRLNVMDGRTEIYAVDLPSGEITPLMERELRNAHPSWSPDGRYLAFTSQEEGVEVIRQMQADGGSKEVLSPENSLKYFTQPAWSPDGKWILATMKDYGTGKMLALVRFERDNPQKGENAIVPDAVQLQDGAFSPDGRWVVYWTYQQGSNMEVLMTGLETGDTVNLSSHKARDFQPTWSR